MRHRNDTSDSSSYDSEIAQLLHSTDVEHSAIALRLWIGTAEYDIGTGDKKRYVSRMIQAYIRQKFY